MVHAGELTIKSLGNCRVDSPLAPLLAMRVESFYYVHESDRVLFDDTVSVVARASA